MNSVIENIITDIESRSKSVKDRVEKNGEVFTPFTLINEMLDKLPSHVWSNPNLKWLDPACGILNFPIILIQRLFIGLQYEITDEYVRMKHIIENMIYMDEYDITNYNLCVEYIQKIGGFKYNIHHGDFLTLDENKMMEIWNANRFDVIVGNPPYNSGGTRNSKFRNFYIMFVKKSFELLSEDGYLDMIHPPRFLRMDDTSYFKKYNLIYLHILTVKEKQTYFKGFQLNADYYVLQKSQPLYNTRITDIYGIETIVNINDFTILPSHSYTLLKTLFENFKHHGKFNTIYSKSGRIFQKINNYIPNVKSVGSRSLQPVKDGIYKNIHLTTSKGFRILKSLTPHKCMHMPKIIINSFGVCYVYYDEHGLYGKTEHSCFITYPSLYELIFFKSHLYQFLNNAYKLMGNNQGLEMFDILPDFSTYTFTNEDEMMTQLGLDEYKDEIYKYKVPVVNETELIEN